MNSTFRLFSKCLATALVTAVVAANSPAHGQGAVATISDTAVSGGFDYTIILMNTGTTDLNSFWYGWTTSGNNLPSVPSTAANSLGWGNTVSGNSIKWINSTGTALAPGDSGSFTFFSASTLAAMTTSPAGESVAYVHGIDFSQGLAGSSTAVFSPTVVPEPSTTALFCACLAGVAIIRNRLKA
jgi:hypothetical protein